MSLPSISIVMPSFNQAAFLQSAIQSILSQNYPNLELIVMDGGSTDSSLEILKQFGSRLRWFSGKDEGQADAVNKGWRMARGEILGWLNSDDLYAAQSLPTVGRFFEQRPKTMWIFGRCGIIDARGKEIRKIITCYKSMRLSHYSYQSLLEENFISQMGVFLRREAFQAVGGLDISRRFAMDYDLWLRLGKKFEPEFIPETLGYFRMYPATKSTTSFRAQFKEDLDVAQKYAGGLWWPIFQHRMKNMLITFVYSLLQLFSRVF